MSSFHIDEAVRVTVARAFRYAQRRRLAAAPAAPALDALTPAQAGLVLRTLDAVCHAASPRALPFAEFAVLDGLCADLADWLRDATGEQPLAA
ncbi:MAG: hypothetical protein QOD81_95 [Solirubrobacteraceae bacterium]|jgi:hypothetical protein|nr:hypothetical protein [Solirubrobacteraceae bacterium]